MTSAKAFLIPAAALAALALAGCNDNRGAGAASGVCKPFTTASNSATNATAPANALPPAPTDASAPLDDCLHRWAYTLAAASDPANVVGEAALAACTDQLSAWNRQGLANGTEGGASVQAPSLINGETTNPLAEHYAFAQGRALFYVVQARAGHCGPPPATTNR
jgi:hypothetical protein